MRQVTAEQLRTSASVLQALASPDALAILQCLVEGILPVTYDAIVEETRLHIDQVRAHCEKLAEVGIVVRHNAPVFHAPLAGFAYLNSEDMPALAECIIEALFGDVVAKWQVA